MFDPVSGQNFVEVTMENGKTGWIAASIVGVKRWDASVSREENSRVFLFAGMRDFPSTVLLCYSIVKRQRS